MLHVHLFGTFYCTREALRIMEPRRSGHIVNIASVAGLGGIPGAPHYGAAKAGIIGFTKSVAPEVIPCGIYVNAVAPGLIDTPMLRQAGDVLIHTTLMRTPIGRLASPDEVANVVYFLATEESSYVVGQVISPNGGLYQLLRRRVRSADAPALPTRRTPQGARCRHSRRHARTNVSKPCSGTAQASATSATTINPQARSRAASTPAMSGSTASANASSGRAATMRARTAAINPVAAIA